MVTDIAILVGLALCQGLTGYWAFHMSTLAEHRRARWGFAAITVIGIALVVWNGIRGATEQQKNQGDIVRGITGVHKDVGAGFTGIHKDLSGISKSVAQKPSVVIQVPPPPPQPKPPLPHAKINIVRFDFVPVEPPDGSGDIWARVIYKNMGAITGYSPAIVTNGFLGEPMPQKQYDAMMDNVRKAALAMRPPHNTEMEPNGIEAYYNVGRLKAADWANVTAGKKVFYAWVALLSSDENLPKGKGFISEAAIVKSAGSEYQFTVERSYFHALKHP